MVLSHGVTEGGKTLVEHLEVIGHRDPMEYMEQMAGASTSPGPSTSTSTGEWEIRNLHSLILQPVDRATGNQDAGRYRALDMRAAGTEHVYPPHYQVPELMAEFVAWIASERTQALHTIEFASRAHFRFVSIHPFRDGNGRAGRLLMNLLLLRAGYPIAVITNARRAEYIEALVYGQGLAGEDTEKASRLTALVAQACRESLLVNLALLSTAGGSRGRGAAFYRAVLPLLKRSRTDEARSCT
jgi:Fic family protein